MKRMLMLALLLLAACATRPTGDAAPPAPHSLADWTAYYLRLHEASSTDLARERSDLALQLAQGSSDTLLLRQATLALAARTGARDFNLIQSSLATVLRIPGTANASERAWASLLNDMAQDQRQLSDQNDRCSTQLKDEQKRGEALKSKLDGMISIDRNLLQRPSEGK